MPVEAQPVATVVDTTGAPGYLHSRPAQGIRRFRRRRRRQSGRAQGRDLRPARWLRQWQVDLLRCLGGFETPTKGSITLDGQRLDALPPYQRPVNMMFQSYALFRT